MIASGEHSFPSEPRRACRGGLNHRFDFIERPDLIAECLARNDQLADHSSICWTNVEGARCATSGRSAHPIHSLGPPARSAARAKRDFGRLDRDRSRSYRDGLGPLAQRVVSSPKELAAQVKWNGV